MAQQTAVDWFSEKVFDLFNEFQRGHISIVDFRLKMITIEEQTKAMEKEQIMKAVYDGMGTNFDPNMGRAEQYYNVTYNK